MSTLTLSSREFNQQTSKAARAAKEGPVFITDRGEPSLVLLSIEEYRKLRGQRIDMGLILSHPPGIEDIDLDSCLPPREDYPRELDLD